MNRLISAALIALLGGFAALPTAQGAIVIKADNVDDLNLASSWVGGILPGPADTATWDATVTGANATLLGANASWRGLAVTDPGGAVTIGAGNTLTVGVGGIDLGAATQNLTISSGLSIGSGHQAWNVANGRTLTLDTGAFTRSSGATLNLPGAGVVAASMTGLANDASSGGGILGPWASVGTGAATRYAALAGGSMVGFTGATAASTAGSAWGGVPSGGAGTINYDITISGTPGATGLARNVNTIRYTGTGMTQQSNNSAVLLTANGIMNVGTGTFVIGTGSFALNVAIGASNELVLHAANAGITIDDAISGAAGAGVTVVGPNVVTFNGPNTYAGGTNINSGTLNLTGSGTLGAAAGAVRVAAGATLNINAPLTLAGAVSGAGAINAANTVTITGNFSGFTGVYTHNSTTSSTGFNSATATSKDAAYVLASTQGSSQGMIAAGNGDYTLEIGSLSGVANSLFRGGNTATGTTTLQIGALNASTTFAGAINNGATKTLALTKVGSGALTLSGANGYTGPTVINSGTLLVHGSTAAGSAVTVNPGGTLGGTGVVFGPVTVNAGGLLAPGSSIESLDVASLDLEGTLEIEYDGAATEPIDVVHVAGLLDLTLGTVKFTPLGAPLTAPSYVFATYGAKLGTAFASVVNLPASYAIDYDFAGGTAVALVQIPEVGAWACVGVAGVITLGVRRARRRMCA